jgi:hypothetical protein
MPNEVKDKFTDNLPKIDMSKVNLERNVEWYLQAMAFRRQALK